MQQPQQPQVDLSKSKPVTCPNCDGRFFKQTMLLQEVSGIMLGLPNNQIIPVVAIRCEDCGTPLVDLLPQGIKI